ncbi:MAG TPA: hypothetical protein VL371_11575 [Gemmataceae bacterium]|jgi:hypothetical protein|nr:hypothetical protein [Gemmataceae bacterium]
MIGGPGFLVVFIVGLMAVCALPLAAVGLILWLCERSWQKPPGHYGSRRYLRAAFVLFLPLTTLSAWGFVRSFLSR